MTLNDVGAVLLELRASYSTIERGMLLNPDIDFDMSRSSIQIAVSDMNDN